MGRASADKITAGHWHGVCRWDYARAWAGRLPMGSHPGRGRASADGFSHVYGDLFSACSSLKVFRVYLCAVPGEKQDDGGAAVLEITFFRTAFYICF